MTEPSYALIFDNYQLILKKRALLSPLTAKCQFGELVGLQAPSGSGKTCLYESLMKTPKKARISGQFKANSKLAYTSQGDCTLVMQLKANENVALSRVDEYGFSQFLRLPKNELKEANHLLEDLGLSEYDKPASLLSGGEKQRVMLARLLFSKRKLWLIDEPVSQLDGISADHCLSKVKTELKKRNACGLLTSHDSSHLEKFCDRILVWNGSWAN